jgi:hypothetical protein
MALLRSAVRSRYAPLGIVMRTQFKNFVVNLYWAQELPGEDLVQHLKKYHGYMVQTITQCPAQDKTYYRIIHIATGIFAYPLLGALATLGMCIKLFGISGVKSHNENEKKSLQIFRDNTVGEDTFSGRTKLGSEWKLKSVQKYTIQPQRLEDVTPLKLDNLVKRLKGDIDFFTQRFEKVYVLWNGNWTTNGMSIYFKVFQSTSPRCRRDDGKVFNREYVLA